MPLFGIDPFNIKLFKKLGTTVPEVLIKRGADRPEPQPRKGLWGLFGGNTVNKRQQRAYTVNGESLARLAKTDPVTGSIIRTIKSFVNQAKWDIEVDTEVFEAELNRWEEYALSHLSPYAIGDLEDFKSEKLDPKIMSDANSRLKAIMKEPTDFSEKNKAIQWYFSSVVRQVKTEAEAHRWPVKAIFERPSERGTEPNLRTLQDILLNDMLVHDAGCLVKNWNRGGELAELYPIPGKSVRRYLNPDKTIPEPPEPAYVWEDGGIIRAEYSRDELVYIVGNPQNDGYGFSPVESAWYIITASIYADEYNIDYFKNSNVPPGVFDLGKDVTEEQRNLFQQMWDNEVRGRGGLHRMLFISGSENPKFMPMRDMSNRDMQMMEYMKWTVAIKTSCFGLSPQDIGFMQESGGLGGGGVAKTQKGLSHSRGIQTLLSLLEQYYNSGIVKQEFKFDDVKFVWKDIDVMDEEKESTIDSQDITNGVLARNDRRKKLGLKPIEGGNVATVTMAGQLIPVSELQQYEEGREDIEEQASNAAGGAPQDLSQTPQPGSQTAQDVQDSNAPPAQSSTGQPPAQKPSEPVQKTPDSNINLLINRRKPIKKQHEDLDAVVKELQAKGIDATLRIGFDDAQK